MSGLNEQFAKLSNSEGSVGSNPTLSAKEVKITDIWCFFNRDYYVIVSAEYQQNSFVRLHDLRTSHEYSYPIANMVNDPIWQLISRIN